MASPKIFCVKNTSTNKSYLIRAHKPADAVAVVLGDEYTAELASNDTVYELARAGTELHAESQEAGAKGAKFVTVKTATNPDTLILLRASSAADAVGRVAGASLKVAVADPETLVELLAEGVVPVNAPGVEAKSAPAAPPEGQDEAGASTTSAEPTG